MRRGKSSTGGFANQDKVVQRHFSTSKKSLGAVQSNWRLASDLFLAQSGNEILVIKCELMNLRLYLTTQSFLWVIFTIHSNRYVLLVPQDDKVVVAVRGISLYKPAKLMCSPMRFRPCYLELIHITRVMGLIEEKNCQAHTLMRIITAGIKVKADGLTPRLRSQLRGQTVFSTVGRTRQIYPEPLLQVTKI